MAAEVFEEDEVRITDRKSVALIAALQGPSRAHRWMSPLSAQAQQGPCWPTCSPSSTGSARLADLSLCDLKAGSNRNDALFWDPCRKVSLIDPKADKKWPNNYGVWQATTRRLCGR